MKNRELANLGIPKGPVMLLMRDAIIQYTKKAEGQIGKESLRQTIRALVDEPADFLMHEDFAPVAKELDLVKQARDQFQERDEPARYERWGGGMEDQSLQQMENACRLPISVAGALMPDAHTGYGLPIGGVLATENAVIPYAVGVDIACRMKMSVISLPVSALQDATTRLRKAIEKETRFGVGATFKKRREHAVMDEDWSFTKVVKQHKDKAWKQLGTSGSGNHFVEFGILTLDQPDLGLEAGVYLALLSHSGSRGTGNVLATHYSELARSLHPELPNDLQHLAWLDLDSEVGQEYWQAMELMGRYAAANHELIHRHVTQNLGVEVLLDIENHHNFAWKEVHLGRELIVHRKGATPAGEGVIGIIPGSMATPGFVVRGKGVAASLNSASHGAGRRMSRKAAKREFTWADCRNFLADRGVTLMSAGLDEVPMAYKDIEEVMQAQQDLVEPIARFDPKLVKMAPPGERPED